MHTTATARFDRAAILRAAWARVRIRKSDVQAYGLRRTLCIAMRAEWSIARAKVEAAEYRAMWAELHRAPAVVEPAAPLTPAQMRRETLLSKDAPLTAADVAELHQLQAAA